MWSTRCSNNGRGKIFFTSIKRPDWLWGPPSSFLMGTGVLCQWCSGQGTKVTTHPHLLLRFRKNGSLSPLPLYAFVSLTRTILPFSYLTVKFNLLKVLKCTRMLQQYCSNCPVLRKTSGDCLYDTSALQCLPSTTKIPKVEVKSLQTNSPWSPTKMKFGKYKINV